MYKSIHQRQYYKNENNNQTNFETKVLNHFIKRIITFTAPFNVLKLYKLQNV